MESNIKKRYIPKLRFKEFQNSSEWEEVTLAEVSERIEEKVGSLTLNTVSITAGLGFVNQVEKFGRDISGEQYEKYILLKEGDFAYNKGNSKKFPQGCICKLKEFKLVAAPNAFICFRFKSNFVPDFYQGYFDNNYHGKQLQKFITSGARSDGLLNIKARDFFSIVLPTPHNKAEQQKIADCLSSLDELIAAQSQKLDALKSYKKGLMQQLFPAEGETKPHFRFPEFQNAGEWKIGTLEEVCDITSGGTPNRSKKEYWNGNIPWVTTTLIDFNTINAVNEFITEEGLKNSSAKIFPKNTILMAMYGQGKTRGKVAILGMDAATNQACAAFILKDGFDTNFVFQNLAARYEEIRKMSNAGGQENLSAKLIETISFIYPSTKAEQQKIADCLFSLDEVIEAQSQKLDALKSHKKGLMQRLFPHFTPLETTNERTTEN